jgi:hypothetical protein
MKDYFAISKKDLKDFGICNTWIDIISVIADEHKAWTPFGNIQLTEHNCKLFTDNLNDYNWRIVANWLVTEAVSKMHIKKWFALKKHLGVKNYSGASCKLKELPKHRKAACLYQILYRILKNR